MLVTLRTYRLFPALIAAAMLFGAAMPLVQEVCAMAEAASMPFGHACCCGDKGTSDHEGVEEPAAMHHQPAAQATSQTSAEAPCHGERDASVEAACCTAQEAAAFQFTTPPPPPEKSPKPALASTGALPPALPGPTSASGTSLLARTSADSPPTSVSPRLLYAVFLI